MSGYFIATVLKKKTIPSVRKACVGVAVGSRCDHAVCCLSSGQGSAGQAAGAEGQRDPAEDLQRDDRLGGAGHAGQTLSALTAALSHLLICVSACLHAWLHPPLFDLDSSFLLLASSFPIIPLFSSPVAGLLIPSFRLLTEISPSSLSLSSLPAQMLRSTW